LALTSLRGVRLVPDGIDDLASEIERERDRKYADARRTPGPSCLPRELKKGQPAVNGSNRHAFGAWREDLVGALQDGRGLQLAPFLFETDGLVRAVEHWPGWAFQASVAIDWRNVMRLCKLVRDLSTADSGRVLPAFQVLPTLRTARLEWGRWSGRAFARLDPRSAGRALRLTFPALRVCTLTETLGKKHPRAALELGALAARLRDGDPGAASEEAVALLTAAGLGRSAIPCSSMILNPRAPRRGRRG